MAQKQFTFYDVFVTGLSFFSIVVDILTDIALIVLFYVEGHTVWGSLTLIFVAMSTFLMQIFSFRWHAVDGKVTLKIFILHAMFLAPLHRYLEVMKLGIKARKTKKLDDLNAVFRANNDICLLRLFESFVESAPQLVLQLYIILCYGHFNWLLGLSTLFSLTSIAWSMTAYADGLRLAYKQSYRRKWMGMVIHTTWQMAMISSRVLAIVIFASLFKAWIFLVLGLHWLLMTCWVTFQNAEFGDTPCEKRLFNTVSGFIYIFCFLNVKDGRSRWRMVIYHIVMLAENTLLVILWFFYKEEDVLWLDVFTLSMVYGGFVIGGSFMLVYYGCCHPSGKRRQEKEEEKTAMWFRRLQNQKPPQKDPIFDTSDSSFRVAEWLHASVNLSNNMSTDFTSVRQDPSIQTPRKDLFTSSKWASNLVNGCTSKQQPSHRSSDENLTIGSDTRHLIYSIPASSVNYKQQMMAQSNIGYIKDKSSRADDTMASTTSLLGHSDNLSSSRSVHGSNLLLLHSDHESFNSTLEFKANKSSPLDPLKLWEQSQERVKESLLQSFSIVTEFDINKGNGTSYISWNNTCNLSVETSFNHSQNQHNSHRIESDERRHTSQPEFKHDQSSDISSFYSVNHSKTIPQHEKQQNHSNVYSGTPVTDRDITSSTFTLPCKWLPSDRKVNPQDPSESAGLTQVSGLSSFFGDISSVYVSETDRKRRNLSLSDTMTLNSSQTDKSTPMMHDQEQESSREDESLSELDYKQEIRKSLERASPSGIYSSLPHRINSRKLLYEYSSSGHESTYNTSNTSDNYRSSEHNSSSVKSSDKDTDDSGYSVSRHSSNTHRTVSSSSLQPSQSISDRSLVPCYERSKSLSYLAFINREHGKRGQKKLHHTRDREYSSSSSLCNEKDKYSSSMTSGSDYMMDHSRSGSEEQSKSSSLKSSLPGLSYLMSESENDESYVTESSVSLMSKPTIADTPWKDDYTNVPGAEERVSSRTSYKELSKASNVHLTEEQCDQATNSDLSPVQVQYMDDSPYRLGRNVDLFNLSAVQTEDKIRKMSSKPPSGFNKFAKLEKMKIEQFTESPYKSRDRDIGCSSSKKMPLSSPLSKVDMVEYAESPYKFRGRSAEKNSQKKHDPLSSKKGRQVNGRSGFGDNKENYVDYDRDTEYQSKRNLTYYDRGQRQQNTNQKLSVKEALNKESPLYQSQGQYIIHTDSDTTDHQSSRSHMDSTDLEDSDIVIDHTRYGTPHTPDSYTHDKYDGASVNSRQALGSLDNCPQFSPIMNPSTMNKSKVFNSSGQIVKPIVSTPRAHNFSRNSDPSEDYEPLTLMEDSLTIKV